MNQRDVTIDIVKGMAILFVVIGHLLQYNTADGSHGVCFNWIYSFHILAIYAVEWLCGCVQPG